MKKFAVFGVAVLLVAGTISVAAQGTKLEDKRVTIKMEKQPLGKVFELLSFVCDIPIGFEESILDRDSDDYLFETNLPFFGDPKKPIVFNSLPEPCVAAYHTNPGYSRGFNVKENWISIDIENGTVKEVFDIIVPQMKNYKWEINDGVVNIIPKVGRDERYERLLNLKVKNYFLEKGAPIGIIRTKIFQLPETVEFLYENKISFKMIRAHPNFIRRIPGIEFDYSDLTFRELLNKITKEKKGGWILKENDRFGSKDDEYIELEI